MTDWLEPSELGNAIEAEYVRHVEAMAPCAELPVRKAFALDSGYIVGILRKVAETYDGKKIAVIDHGTGFEVRRFDDWFDLATFYALSSGPKNEEAKDEPTRKLGVKFSEVCVVKLREALVELPKLSEERLTGYDPKMTIAVLQDCVTATYLTRKLSQSATFRKSPKGGNVALKDAISELIEQEVLTKLDSSEAQAIIQSTATLYKVNRELL